MQPLSPFKAALLWSTGALLFFSACSKQDDVTLTRKINADNNVALIIPIYHNQVIGGNFSYYTFRYKQL